MTPLCITHSPSRKVFPINIQNIMLLLLTYSLVYPRCCLENSFSSSTHSYSLVKFFKTHWDAFSFYVVIVLTSASSLERGKLLVRLIVNIYNATDSKLEYTLSRLFCCGWESMLERRIFQQQGMESFESLRKEFWDFLEIF